MDINAKLSFVVSELNERFGALLKLTSLLYKEDSENGKLYHPVAVLLLTFCFIDFLKRFNHILILGKDGSENQDNKSNYINFLNKFVINNAKYDDCKCSFTAEQLYGMRCDLVHSLGVKSFYGGTQLSFVGGTDIDDIINYFRLDKAFLPKVSDLQEIIKYGMKLMLFEYERLLLIEAGKREEDSPLSKNINTLFDDLNETPCFFIGFKKFSK